MVQFSLVSFIITALIAAVLSVILSHKIRAQAVDALLNETVGNVHGRLLRAITPADLENPMSGDRLKQFDAFVQASIISDRTARVKLWAKDGTLIYSDDPALIGKRFPIHAGFLKALQGESTVSISTPNEAENEREAGLGTLIEVYAPIWFTPSVIPEGIFEIYQYYEPTAQRIRTAKRWLFGSIGIGFLLLYGCLGTIVWGGWRTIQRQRLSLTETNAALRQARDELEQRVQERTADLTCANLALRRHNIEQERTETALRKSEQRLHVLSSHLLAAQERERKRLSLELHDAVGQPLTTLKLELSSLKKRCDPVADCDRALQYVNLIIEDVRRLARGLSPSILEDLGLTAAFRWMSKDFAKCSQITVDLDIPELNDMFPKESHIIVYRLFQEAFANIGKHAQATQVNVVVKPKGDHVAILIADDGVGFDVEQPQAVKPPHSGMGLVAMHERARLLGGSLTIVSRRGRGTHLYVNVPKHAKREGSVAR